MPRFARSKFAAAVVPAMLFASPGLLAADATASPATAIRVVVESRHDTSPPLRDIPPLPLRARERDLETETNHLPKGTASGSDAALQITAPLGPGSMSAPLVNFDGMSEANSGCNCAPAHIKAF